MAGANEHGGGERRETWEYSARTERTVREYRAKFASLFSALERRGPTDNGGPLTVAEP